MRTSIFASLVLIAACHKAPTGGGDDDTGPDANALGTAAFSITSPGINLMPGEEETVCYYFHTSNTTTVAVNKWVSDMTPGSHHAILFMTPTGTPPPDGTVSMDNCGLGGTSNVSSLPIWTYATQTTHQEEDLPADDGNGLPLAQNIAPNSAGYLQLHYLNATDSPITAHIDLEAYALPANTTYTQTDAYVTYNQSINIPAGAVAGAPGTTATASCPVPQGVKFWTMSTHSHKQSQTTEVMDGSSMIFSSSDWEHPGAQNWMATPFYTFSTPNLTWTCNYANDAPPPYCNAQGASAAACSNANTAVVSGQSAVTNEMCMATGYYFPATEPKFEVYDAGSCFGL